jgi:hypothetical protein
MWIVLEVEWMPVGGMEAVVGGAGYGIELEKPVADSRWSSVP